MRYKILGRSGLKVSELCLGTMTFGEEWGFGASREESKRQFDLFTAAGGNFIDTANAYTNGTSEKLVGEFVASERDRFVVATKYTVMQRPGDPNSAGNHRKSMVTAVEASLRRLGLSYIDLYWVHAADGVTPPEELMRGLDDLVRAGKVLYVGVSDTPAWQVARANMLAELRGWSAFAGLQIEYSLIERTVERELLPMARACDLAVCAWGALGGGVLTGKYKHDGAVATADDATRVKANAERSTPAKLKIAGEVVAIAKELDKSPAQVALNWVRQQRGVIIPIVAARRASQLEDNLAALSFRLGDEHLARLAKASAIDLGFPHDFLRREGIRKIVESDAFDRIDNHRA